MQLTVFKKLALPAELEPHSIYFIENDDADHIAETYITSSTGVAKQVFNTEAFNELIAALDLGGGAWGGITGTLSDQVDLQAALDSKQASLGFTPVPNTRTVNGHALSANVTLVKADVELGSVDNVQQLPMSYLDTDDTLAANSDVKVASQKAAKTYVDTKVAALVDSSPATLDTLNELAAALGDDPNFATTVATEIGTKLAKAANLSDLVDVAVARTNLGLAIGSNVQAYNANLDTFAGIAPSTNVQALLAAANYAAFRTALGLGTGDTPTFAGITINASRFTVNHASNVGMLFNIGGTPRWSNAVYLPSGTNYDYVLYNEQGASAGVSLMIDGDSNNFGIRTVSPRRRLDILDASDAQLRLTHTDNSVYTDFQTNSSGNLIISPTGTLAIFGKAVQLPTIADGSAPNNSFYYSSTAGKLVFKDASGVVSALY